MANGDSLLRSITIAVSVAFAAGAGLIWRSRGQAPRGKGVFVRSVKHAETPAEMVAMCKVLGLSWVTIGFMWQEPGKKTKRYHIDKIPAYADALERAGIKVWLWAFPSPGKAPEITAAYRALAKRTKLRGLILDPEKPYQGTSNAVAKDDVDEFRRLGVPLGCTSYGGGPPNHPHFPWVAWQETDFGMPQIYDTYHKLGPKYPANAMDYWRGKGSKKFPEGFRGWDRIVPIWGASSKHTPEQMRTIISNTPRAFKAAAWWDYYWLELSSARRRVVSRYKVGRRVA